MSRIILDTSVLVPDFRFRSVTLQGVLKAALDFSDRVLVPSVVVDELVNKFRDEASDSLEALRRVEGKLNVLLKQPLFAHEIEVEQEVMQYRAWVQETFETRKIEELQYPDGDHREFVARALQRRKPFDGNGQRGYRDAVVWETVLRDLRTHGQEIFFVSRNTHDFADGKVPTRLHPQLEADVQALHRRGKVLFFAGLEDFLARAVTPRQGIIPEIKAQIQAGRLGKRQLKEWLLEVLPAKLKQASIDWVFRPSMRRRKDLIIAQIRSLEPPSLSSTSSLTDHSILVVLFLELTAELDLFQREFQFEHDENEGENLEKFLAIIGVEIELETHDVLALTVDRLINLGR